MPRAAATAVAGLALAFALAASPAHAFAVSGGADSWVCRPSVAVREPYMRIDTDRFFQDQYRPSAPGPSVPTKP